MATFLETANRIMTELRRSNMLAAAKQAINDAILQESKYHFYFNEMKAVTFNTVSGTEYYADGGLSLIDAAYYMQGAVRHNLDIRSKLAHDVITNTGPDTGAQPEFISRQDTMVRVYPVPSTILPIYLDGYGVLTPYPLVADADTNAWLVQGEMLIRNVAKALLLKDVIRDLGEAAAFEAMAADQRSLLEVDTAVRFGTDTVVPTRW